MLRNLWHLWQNTAMYQVASESKSWTWNLETLFIALCVTVEQHNVPAWMLWAWMDNQTQFKNLFLAHLTCHHITVSVLPFNAVFFLLFQMCNSPRRNKAKELPSVLTRIWKVMLNCYPKNEDYLYTIVLERTVDLSQSHLGILWLASLCTLGWFHSLLHLLLLLCTSCSVLARSNICQFCFPRTVILTWQKRL